MNKYGYGTEEHHIAATIIQCMVRRDQAIMFVDVLWEQTAAALSLQSIVRAFLVRKKYLQLLKSMDQPSSLNKYQQRNPPRADSRASQLSSTQWSSDFDESEWEERYYQSSPEPSMIPQKKNQNSGLTKQNLAFFDKEPSPASQPPQQTSKENEANKTVPIGSVAAQRKAIEIAAKQKKIEEEKEKAERQERAVERRQRAESKQKIRLEQLEHERQQQYNNQILADQSQAPIHQLFKHQPPQPRQLKQSYLDGSNTPDSEESHPISPTLTKLQKENQGQVKRTAERLATKTPTNIPEDGEAPEPSSPLRQRLDGSGVAMRAAASLRTESMDRVASRPPSRQNDTEEVVAQGALLRAAESFGSSLQKTQNRMSENDAALVARPGVAANRAAKLEQDAAWAAAAKWRDLAAEHSRAKPFKFQLSDNSVAPMIGFGSAFEPGMQKAKSNRSDSITLGASGGEYVKDGHLSLFGSGSTSAPGMVQMRTHGDDITRGASAGKSVHHGGTFATCGSLNAPGMGQTKFVSPEVAGAAAGASIHQGGTLLTNGSVNAPGMSGNKNNSNKFGTSSCDTGISLFGMGSTLSQANFEESRQKQINGKESGFMNQSVSSVDLPLWSLGSSISVAAMEEQKQRQSMANSITFGATAGGYGHKNNAGSSDVPKWSQGSSCTPGMARDNSGIRTNTNGAKSQALGSATLMSFGSSGTPGMQRDIPASIGGNLRGSVHGQAVACSSEPSLMMMGSSKTSGMQAIKNDHHGSTGTRNILPGTYQNDPEAEYQGGSSRYTGTKWTVGNHGASTLAMTESNYTSQNAMMTSQQLGTSIQQQHNKDNEKMVSVDKSGGGTLMTSGSHATMGRRNASEIDGAGRSITYGAEVTGKSVYSGPTFSTGGSAGLNNKPNKVVEMQGVSKPSVHRPPQPPTKQASMGRSSALAKVPPPVPAVSAYEYQRKTESGPSVPSISNRHGRSSPEKSFQVRNDENEDDDERNTRGNSMSSRRNRSPDKLLNQTSGGGSGGQRTSAGQQAVDRAMARAKAAAAVIAASQTTDSNLPMNTTSSTRRYESMRKEEPSRSRRYDSTNRDQLNSSTRYESTKREEREEYDSFDNEQISSASILRDALNKKREPTTKHYSSYSRDLPPAPSESDLYSDLSSTYSSNITSTIREDSVVSNHQNNHHHQSTNNRRNIIDKLLNSDMGTEQGRERRELARLERQAARQARSLAATSQTSESYSYEPSSSSTRRHRTLMV